MAELHGFDANAIVPSGDFELIPAGKYIAIITGSEIKSNKAGTGKLLQLTFKITEGEHLNRQLRAWLNIGHSNPKTVQIAMADLSAICRAIGVLAPKDTVELHNLPMVIFVREHVRKDTGEIVNEIKGYASRPPSIPATTVAPSNPPSA